MARETVGTRRPGGNSGHDGRSAKPPSRDSKRQCVKAGGEGGDNRGEGDRDHRGHDCEWPWVSAATDCPAHGDGDGDREERGDEEDRVATTLQPWVRLLQTVGTYLRRVDAPGR